MSLESSSERGIGSSVFIRLVIELVIYGDGVRTQQITILYEGMLLDVIPKEYVLGQSEFHVI